jgi:hypothetical protein
MYNTVKDVEEQELMGWSWVTTVGEPLLSEEWELMQGQDQGRQGRGYEVKVG